MAEARASASGGIGLTGVLFITFLILKLTGVIDWSWWWVTCPLWGGVAVVLAACLVFFCGLLAFFALEKLIKRS